MNARETPEANPDDYAAGTRWMCKDGAVWETRWHAYDQRWTWVAVEQDGA